MEGAGNGHDSEDSTTSTVVAVQLLGTCRTKAPILGDSTIGTAEDIIMIASTGSSSSHSGEGKKSPSMRRKMMIIKKLGTSAAACISGYQEGISSAAGSLNAMLWVWPCPLLMASHGPLY